MKRCLLLALLFIASQAHTGEAEIIEELRKRLAIYDGVTGYFQQEKHLSFMDTPFVSSGNFTATLEQGLQWHVTSPLESLMIVTKQGVILDGKRVRDPGVGTIMARIMKGFMNGDLESLEQDFHLTGDFAREPWKLDMRPANPLLSQVLSTIEVSGTHTLSSIVVREKSGNYTVMTLTGIQESD
ncbi:outer membrane lipoprotein carrier protein LolA [Pseudohalioglobus sediminis]|uniref:Outer membrane lipoprotein carrier protein LolA n=1 Tax=Pseudohalioglobus sediminis TaxID=2606449 RepID=A0A5B0WTT6_9GAMM|nr:outer membrane lipoprotein carrier protein LolA [Pseudohalioglobus sediminis]KAA1190490.1 outer membrane lipoprotein carrier protein LolA [Pseudohalioglobus sediminis]